jgi:hypothetical protein
MDTGDAELPDVFNQMETAFRQVLYVGTSAQVAAARELLVSVRRQLYRILADDTEQPPLFPDTSGSLPIQIGQYLVKDPQTNW